MILDGVIAFGSPRPSSGGNGVLLCKSVCAISKSAKNTNQAEDVSLV